MRLLSALNRAALGRRFHMTPGLGLRLGRSHDARRPPFWYRVAEEPVPGLAAVL